jgi:hypothetical protein
MADAHLIMAVVRDLARLPDLLLAWQEIGLPGATILESEGTYHAATWLTSMGLSALDHLLEAGEVEQRTVFLALDDPELLARAIAEAERVMGGFDRSESGLLLVLPVTQSRGLRPGKTDEKSRREA